MNKALESRLEWTFDPALQNPELRKARALEYIAYYLDRVDMRLEAIAEDLRQQSSSGKSG